MVEREVKNRKMLTGEAAGLRRSQRVEGLVSQAGGLDLVLETQRSSKKSINTELG